jgi:hypothetical protein
MLRVNIKASHKIKGTSQNNNNKILWRTYIQHADIIMKTENPSKPLSSKQIVAVARWSCMHLIGGRWMGPLFFFFTLSIYPLKGEGVV